MYDTDISFRPPRQGIHVSIDAYVCSATNRSPIFTDDALQHFLRFSPFGVGVGSSATAILPQEVMVVRIPGIICRLRL